MAETSEYSAINRTLEFCETLIARRVRYTMDIVRDGSLMVTVAVPGERWEVEFMDDGSVELERFISSGVEDGVDPIALIAERMA